MEQLKAQIKEPRYVVSQFGLKGSLILFPDPEVISVGFENLSDSGVCIKILADLKPKQKKDLDSLINASKLGNLIPVQLVFNEVKIPVNVLNNFDGNKYGLCISGHQKLSALAEKGKQFFQALTDGAVKKGASAADFVDYDIASRPKKSEAAPLPDSHKDLPPKHPTVDLVRTKFEAFAKKVIFLRSLGPIVAGYYVDFHLPEDCEMRRRMEDDDNFKRDAVLRWAGIEFNEIIGAKDKKVGGIIEENFKQAIYSYMLRMSANTISFDEILSLFDGKLPEPMRDLRDKFLESVCLIIEDAVEKRFDQYLADSDHDRSKAEEEKGEEQAILRMTPEDLMKRFLWPKIIESGMLFQIQKDVAKTWSPQKKGATISDMGGVVVLSQSSYEEFLTNAKEAMVVEEDPGEYFDAMDLWRIYEKTVEVDGRKRKTPFGMYVESLHPYSRRKLIMTKVINSPQWSQYYILKKKREQLGKVFGVKAPAMLEFVEKNMLTDYVRENERYV